MTVLFHAVSAAAEPDLKRANCQGLSMWIFPAEKISIVPSILTNSILSVKTRVGRYQSEPVLWKPRLKNVTPFVLFLTIQWK